MLSFCVNAIDNWYKKNMIKVELSMNIGFELKMLKI